MRFLLLSAVLLSACHAHEFCAASHVEQVLGCEDFAIVPSEHTGSTTVCTRWEPHPEEVCDQWVPLDAGTLLVRIGRVPPPTPKPVVHPRE